MDGGVAACVVAIVRVLHWIVCCVFKGLPDVFVRHDENGDALLNGYPGTQVPGTKNLSLIHI